MKLLERIARWVLTRRNDEPRLCGNCAWYHDVYCRRVTFGEFTTYGTPYPVQNFISAVGPAVPACPAWRRREER